MLPLPIAVVVVKVKYEHQIGKSVVNFELNWFLILLKAQWARLTELKQKVLFDEEKTTISKLFDEQESVDNLKYI